MKFYKILYERKVSPIAFYKYPQKGQWTPKKNIIPCVSGYHVVTKSHIKFYLSYYPKEVWEVEVKEKGIRHESLGNVKYVFKSIRLIKKIGTFTDLQIKELNQLLKDSK